MTKLLLSQPQDPGTTNKLYLLSERISQDPLENYFGKQRARGGKNENHNLQQCVQNATALHVQSPWLWIQLGGTVAGRGGYLVLSNPRLMKHVYQNAKRLP